MVASAAFSGLACPCLACTGPPALAAVLWLPVAFFRFPAQSEPRGAVLSRCRSVKTSPEDAFRFARSSAGVMPETVQQRILRISAARSTLERLRLSCGPVWGRSSASSGSRARVPALSVPSGAAVSVFLAASAASVPVGGYGPC